MSMKEDIIEPTDSSFHGLMHQGASLCALVSMTGALLPDGLCPLTSDDQTYILSCLIEI